MGSFDKKMRRKKYKESKKAIQEKMALFGKLGDNCETCQKPFDKKDPVQVKSWSVVVKEEEGKVRLYCPECWDKAVNIIKDFKKRVEARNDN
jgi:Zn finger protein HypA/HybF involved in hydrogenase expression